MANRNILDMYNLRYSSGMPPEVYWKSTLSVKFSLGTHAQGGKKCIRSVHFVELRESKGYLNYWENFKIMMVLLLQIDYITGQIDKYYWANE